MEGQIDLERRALAGCAVYPNVAVALFHNAVDGGKTEACALAALFGSKERFEDVGQNRWVHPCSRVGNGKTHVISNAGTRMSPRVGLVHVRVCGLNLKLAAVGHSVA